MSKESNRNITRRNVLAGIGASGIGLALGAHGVAAGEQADENDDYHVPVAIDWQESLYKSGKWKHVEAFPDSHNDAVQDDYIDYCDGGMLKDALIDIDDPLSSDLRTNNKYTDPGDPMIDFHDVKPGYGGEATLSYHVCDQPGKVKLKAKDVHVDKKLAHLARARVWYDEYDGSKGSYDHNDGHSGSPGDNVYQPYEPIIAQGSLKTVLHKLENGIHVSGDPYVASPNDMEGINYYGYPRKNTSSMETPPAKKYEPGWITDDTVDEYVHEKEIKELKHLEKGIRLSIEGTGYVARNEDKPLPDLRITVEEVITDKKGKPVGFEWKSNLPICRIEIASGEHTKLNVFDRAREGIAMAPLYDDHTDDKKGQTNDHRRRPMTGVRFGVCGERNEDDYCIENSNTGYIGFEWWVPKHVDLKGKKKFRSNFHFEAKPCKDHNGNGDNGNGNGDNGRREISFVAFCVDEDDIEQGDSFEDFTITVSETNEDGEAVGIDWESGDIPVQTVVLFGGGDWFNTDYDPAMTSGTTEMGQSGEGVQRSGQTQSAPCAFDENYCSVKFNQASGDFTTDDPMDNCFGGT